MFRPDHNLKKNEIIVISATIAQGSMNIEKKKCSIFSLFLLPTNIHTKRTKFLEESGTVLRGPKTQEIIDWAE